MHRDLRTFSVASFFVLALPLLLVYNYFVAFHLLRLDLLLALLSYLHTYSVPIMLLRFLNKIRAGKGRPKRANTKWVLVASIIIYGTLRLFAPVHHCYCYCYACLSSKDDINTEYGVAGSKAMSPAPFTRLSAIQLIYLCVLCLLCSCVAIVKRTVAVVVKHEGIDRPAPGTGYCFC